MIFLILSFSLSLQEAIDRGMESSPVYLQAKKQFFIQQKNNSLVYSAMLPQVNGGYNYRRSRSMLGGVDVFDTTDAYSVSMNWTLSPTDFISAFSTHYKNSAAYFTFMQSTNEIIFTIITQYLNSLMTEDLLLSREKAVERTENNLELVREQMQLGSASRAELLKARVDYLQARYDFLNARKQNRVSRLKLKRVIGLEPGDTISLSIPEVDSQLPGKDSILTLAYISDPELNLYESEVKSSRLDLMKTSADRIFDVRFTGDYGYTGEDFPSSGVWDDGDSYSIGVSITVPIFTGFSRVNSIMISKLQYSLSKSKMMDRKRQLRIEVENTYLEFQESRERLSLSETTLELAEESYRAAEERYKLGEASIIEFLGAQEDLLQAQYARTQALFDHYISIFRLKRLMGRLK